MKRTIILLVVLGLIACEQHGSLLESDIGRNLAASKGDALTVRDLQTRCQFSVTVLDISDYRCPVGVYCLAIWRGGASVNFEIASNMFSLLLGESKELTISQRAYRITLKDVVPYPIYQKEAKQQAVFVIERI